jgi:hypothetical protein
LVQKSIRVEWALDDLSQIPVVVVIRAVHGTQPEKNILQSPFAVTPHQ